MHTRVRAQRHAAKADGSFLNNNVVELPSRPVSCRNHRASSALPRNVHHHQRVRLVGGQPASAPPARLALVVSSLGGTDAVAETSSPAAQGDGASHATPPQPAAAPSWPALDPPFNYHASAEDAQSGAVPTGLSPLWKMLLLSDGSVTRHLQLLSGSPVSVECLSTRHVGFELAGCPPGVELIPGPRVQRQVLLRCRPQALAGTAASSAAAAAAPAAGSSASAAGAAAGPSTSAAASGIEGRGSPGAASRSGISRSNGRQADGDQGADGAGFSGCSGGSDAGASNGQSVGAAASTSSSSSSSSGSTGGADCRGGPNGVPAGAYRGGGENGSEDSGSGGVGGSANRPDGEAPGVPLDTPGVPLVYASSWWNADAIEQYLRDRSQPIWISLSQGHVELYREVRALLRGTAPPELSRLLELEGGAEGGAPGGAGEQPLSPELWGRYYVFWSGGKPLTLIYEVFSPRLTQFLGPVNA